MKKAVQVILINPEGLILAVSRKDNHNNFGLIGGKVDPEDNDDIKAAAIRETKEETGLDIYNLRIVYSTFWDTRMQYTFLADYKGDIKTSEPHIVKWVPFSKVIEGSFGDFNKRVWNELALLNLTQYIKE